MKKLCISFVLILIILLTAVYFQGSDNKTDYLRIHIRANSNELEDQSVKYDVKDLVVAYLTPIIENALSKSDAIAKIQAEENTVKRLIDGFLVEKGYQYTSRITIGKESFPTRVYDDETFPAGIYDAVIIELGSGVGDNWWCVVYPPLCFQGEDVQYRSIIYEFLKRFLCKEDK